MQPDLKWVLPKFRTMTTSLQILMVLTALCEEMQHLSSVASVRFYEPLSLFGYSKVGSQDISQKLPTVPFTTLLSRDPFTHTGR
jgi:hypothetical protein